MYNDELLKSILGPDLKLSESNKISDGDNIYATFDGNNLIGVNAGSKPISIDDITYVQFDKVLREMEVGLERDGEQDIVHMVPGPADDGSDIVMHAMPMCTLDLDVAFTEIYRDYAKYLYYDELRERDMVDMAMFGCPAEGVVPITDRVVKIYHRHFQQRLRACGYIGARFPSNLVMDEVLDIRIGSNRRNPFRDWVESHTWDGVERLRDVAIDYFGATAPALRGSDGAPTVEEERYLRAVTEAWFLGGITRMYTATQHDIVPVFIGIQGGGKGTGLRFLAGDDEWYAATTADVSNPERFLESVRGAIIVEMGESKQLRGKGVQEDLKAFISQREDRIRKKYARYEETYPRHFILAATANNDSLFEDPTGARRFYPIYCNPDLATKEIPVRARREDLQYEVEQIWAEALYLYRKGHKCYVGKEIDELARVMQKDAAMENPMAEYVEDWLNDPVNGYTKVGSKIYREKIMEDVFGVDFRCPSPMAERAWRDWVDSDKRWTKCKPFYANGKTRRGYERTLEPDAKVKVKTLKLVDGDEPIDFDETKDKTRYRQNDNDNDNNKDNGNINVVEKTEVKVEERVEENAVKQVVENPQYTEANYKALLGELMDLIGSTMSIDMLREVKSKIERGISITEQMAESTTEPEVEPEVESEIEPERNETESDVPLIESEMESEVEPEAEVEVESEKDEIKEDHPMMRSKEVQPTTGYPSEPEIRLKASPKKDPEQVIEEARAAARRVEKGTPTLLSKVVDGHPSNIADRRRVEESTEELNTGQPPTDTFLRWAREAGLKEDDRVDVAMLPEVIVASLIDNGYLYVQGTPSKPIFRIGALE